MTTPATNIGFGSDHQTDQGGYLPTLAEIKQRTAEIRSQWDETRRRKASAHDQPVPASVPLIGTHGIFEARGSV